MKSSWAGPMFQKVVHSFFTRLLRVVAFKKPLEIYTDGSEKNGRGSWAYVVVENGQVIREASGKARKVTSTQMEMQAAIEALQSVSDRSHLKLYSDSRILIDTMKFWRHEWKQNAWLKSSGVEIPNVELIKKLDHLDSLHLIQWSWVKAHAGISFNERCDEMCRTARETPERK